VQLYGHIIGIIQQEWGEREKEERWEAGKEGNGGREKEGGERKCKEAKVK